jgi:hypothetical protein
MSSIDWKKMYQKVLADKKALKKELEKKEENLLYYRMYVYSVDPDADCSPNKDDVDKFTDDPQQRKILYERLGYESDDDELKEENKKLKKYETMIHNVWEELYWKDKYGEDVGWKDISQCVMYDEEFVKKEVVCDDED